MQALWQARRKRATMFESFRTDKLIQDLRNDMQSLPDSRTGKNKQYEIRDAGMSAFAVFFTQCGSFLEGQRQLEVIKGQSNGQKLFGMDKTPSDNQIRNLLDGVSPQNLSQSWKRLWQDLKKEGVLDTYRSYGNRLLVAIDGTEYHHSQDIHCEQCSRREMQNGKTQYFHIVLTPVVVKPGCKQVLTLEPEFVAPQDGHEKQDCEINAAKRWLEKHAEQLREEQVTILGDDLYSHEPYCRAILEEKLSFLLVCKTESHLALYDNLETLEKMGQVQGFELRKWNGKHGEIWRYRFAEQLPLTWQKDCLRVNWLQITITEEETGKQLYKNAFITNVDVTEVNVEALINDGRSRWKVENENNNVLKNHGYHLEHNFGHGNQYLSSTLLTLNLLAFLFHTILEIVDEKYKAIRLKLGKRITFFNDIDALLRYHIFESWEDLFTFMFVGLKLGSK